MPQIKKEIEKQISDYEQKIAECDVLIDGLKAERRLFRSYNDTNSVKSVSKELAVKQAQRQAYVQAKSDFDSLLDFL